MPDEVHVDVTRSLSLRVVVLLHLAVGLVAVLAVLGHVAACLSRVARRCRGCSQSDEIANRTFVPVSDFVRRPLSSDSFSESHLPARKCSGVARAHVARSVGVSVANRWSSS